MHFSICLLPLFQNESRSTTFHMETSSLSQLQFKLISISMVVENITFWIRGRRQLGKGWFSLAHKHKHKHNHNQPKSKWELPRHNYKLKHEKNEHVPFFLCLRYAYVTLVSSEKEDEISTSIHCKHKAVNHDRLVLDTAFAYVFMVMFWRPPLLSADYTLMLMLVLMR